MPLPSPFARSQSDFKIIPDQGGAGGGAASSSVDDYGSAVDPDSFMDLVSGVDRKGGKIADEALKMGYLHLDQKTKEEYRQKDFWGKLRSGAEDRVTPADRRRQEEEKAREDLRLEVADLAEGTGVVKGRDGKPDMKVVAENKEMDVLAEVHYVPLGLTADGQGARYTMAGLRARRVVILGKGSGEKGEGEDAQDLLEEKVKRWSEVFRPALGEKVDMKVGTKR